jgi:hypothetical protein
MRTVHSHPRRPSAPPPAAARQLVGVQVRVHPHLPPRGSWLVCNAGSDPVCGKWLAVYLSSASCFNFGLWNPKSAALRHPDDIVFRTSSESPGVYTAAACATSSCERVSTRGATRTAGGSDLILVCLKYFLHTEWSLPTTARRHQRPSVRRLAGLPGTAQHLGCESKADT